MSTDIDRAPGQAVQLPGRLGQGTAVEQSRAVAEVAAAVQVAQQYRRNTANAVRQMTEACQQPKLAERSVFAYRRAGSQITGPTVHLARELARCWGNVQYGLTELLRDDAHGQSEMMAWAWDVETNTRASTTFIVPHQRDKDGKRVPLTTDRDIYENNSNNGARRVREQIFAILPAWFVEEARDRCDKTIKSPKDEQGREIPLAKRVAAVIDWFSREGVSVDQLEARQGRASGDWTPQDVAHLGVVYRTLQRGETTVGEEFTIQRVTGDEIKAAARRPRKTAAPRASEPPREPEGNNPSVPAAEEPERDPAEPSDEEWARMQGGQNA